MKIAILGWGSLIWKTKELFFDKEEKKKKEGPILTIEFARISNNGRLTLVLTEMGTEVSTLFTLSKYNTIDEAILNLAIREGSGRKSIGSYTKDSDVFKPEVFEFKKNIKKWIQNTDFDAVIWTNLGEKGFEDDTSTDSNKKLEYLKELRGNKKVLAEEYIRKTPIQIKTRCRDIFEKELKWTPIV